MLSDATRSQIQSDIDNNHVMLYMKGTKDFPQCGFSNQVVRILNHLGTDYETSNVLDNQDIREGIKEFSDWPTIPQLYIGGEFIGGCDIVTEMFQNQKLQEKLKPQPA